MKSKSARQEIAQTSWVITEIREDSAGIKLGEYYDYTMWLNEKRRYDLTKTTMTIVNTKNFEQKSDTVIKLISDKSLKINGLIIKEQERKVHIKTYTETPIITNEMVRFFQTHLGFRISSESNLVFKLIDDINSRVNIMKDKGLKVTILNGVLPTDNNKIIYNKILGTIINSELVLYTERPPLLINTNNNENGVFSNVIAKNIKYDKIETSNLENLDRMFKDSKHKINRIDTWDLSNIQTTIETFANTRIYELDLNNLDISKSKATDNMFNGAQIDILRLNVSDAKFDDKSAIMQVKFALCNARIKELYINKEIANNLELRAFARVVRNSDEFQHSRVD